MNCPKCQKDDILVAVNKDGEETFICEKCRAFWDEDMEVLGKISSEQLAVYQNIIEWNTLIDQIDFQQSDAQDIEKCIFCDKLAVKDGDDYKCYACGNSWSVI